MSNEIMLSCQVLTPGQTATFTVLANQTATHAVPAILNSLSSALLRAVTGDQDASIAVNNHPLATLAGEKAIAVSPRNRQASQGGSRNGIVFYCTLREICCMYLSLQFKWTHRHYKCKVYRPG